MPWGSGRIEASPRLEQLTNKIMIKRKEAAERVIKKNESRYISREISFERKSEDLRKWYIESKSLPF